jgi:hypothetical protein
VIQRTWAGPASRPPRRRPATGEGDHKKFLYLFHVM